MEERIATLEETISEFRATSIHEKITSVPIVDEINKCMESLDSMLVDIDKPHKIHKGKKMDLSELYNRMDIIKNNSEPKILESKIKDHAALNSIIHLCDKKAKKNKMTVTEL
uniref:Uncharacterized protein n=1 Tax=Mimivirus LCMiAC01 TaxID=2506608 RepID=A0A481Z0H3_9VIRU|nr:MAG: hypothetical protein LCMiAC01_04420 [Mimivirus LCMiAC01]